MDDAENNAGNFFDKIAVLIIGFIDLCLESLV